MGMIETRERMIDEIEDKLKGDLTEGERESLEKDKKRMEEMNENASNLRDIVDFL